MNRRLAWMLAWLLLAAWPAMAQAGRIEIGPQGSHVLTRSFDVLVDPEHALRIEDMARPQVQAGFRPVAGSGPGANFGLTLSAIWLRVTLDVAPEAAGDWLLEIGYATIDRAELTDRKFNRMRPSMARVLGLETRSAKEG